MARASRAKGVRGEREIVAAFRAAGFDGARTPNSGGLTFKGDLHGIPGFHIEVKRRERPDVPGAVRQAGADCPPGSTPAVCWRRSREAWHIDLPLSSFLLILARAEANGG